MVLDVSVQQGNDTAQLVKRVTLAPLEWAFVNTADLPKLQQAAKIIIYYCMSVAAPFNTWSVHSRYDCHTALSSEKDPEGSFEETGGGAKERAKCVICI